MKKPQAGFTIVELLIVIVVIAILAAISIVAYNGIQQRARDTQRNGDVATIVKALEMYYADNGRYPTSSCTTACTINNGWSTTNDQGWSNLAAQLVPKYMSSLPSDPNSSIASSPLESGRFGYAYYANASNYCGAAVFQMYILVYTLEGAQKNSDRGTCSTNLLGPYSGKSNYRVVLGT